MAKLEEKLLDHPQLIGTSRHITGAYSIRELSWDAAGKTLHGVSEVAPGADYTLFIRCPAGMRATAGPTSLGGGRPVPVRQATNGNLLAVSFQGPESPVAWHVKF